MSIKLGYAAEALALKYLLNHGLIWICSNYRCRMGEIDLILQDHDDLVFTEVKSRSSQAFGGAIASITYYKRQKLLRTAQNYLQVNRIYDTKPVRFDVVNIDGIPPKITWLKNAFEQY